LRLRTLLAVAVACSAPAGRAAAQVPVVTTLDSAGNVGRGSAVALRADGRGFVAYVDATNAGLKVASCHDVACTSALIGTIDPGGPFHSVAVAIGPSGRPVVAYQAEATSTLRVAYCDDADCTGAVIQTLDASGPLDAGTAIVIGADSLPLLVYGSAGGEVRTAHCEDAGCTARTVTPHTDALPHGLGGVAVALGADGLPVLASAHQPDLRVGHCSNPACTAATFTRIVGIFTSSLHRTYSNPSLALGNDGLMGLALLHNEQGFPFPPPAVWVELRRCADVGCTSLGPDLGPGFGGQGPIIRTGPGNGPVMGLQGGSVSGGLNVRFCSSLACPTTSPLVEIDVSTYEHAMAVAPLGEVLLGYYDLLQGDLKVAWLGVPQGIAIGDVTTQEGHAGQTLALLPVTLPGAANATVDFTTADGTATAGADYLATSGTLTFTPGSAVQMVTVSVLGDLQPEADETFRVLLSNAQGAPLADGEGVGTIDDDEPHVSVANVATLEGDAGTTDALFVVSLDAPGGGPVLLDFTTAGETATPGVDFLPAAGTLTFATGETSRVVAVPVVGDLDVESDETFRLLLSNVQGGIIDDEEGVGLILNDDAEPPILGELRHGAWYTGDLAAQAGPAADLDEFRIAQDPYGSYEVVADAVSGDAVPVVLERRDAAGAVLQSAAAVGTGSARSLRWQVAGTTTVSDQIVRLGGACGASCGRDDVYRIRAYETTLRAARFNNSATQTTVLLLQNASDAPAALAVHFWAPDGSLIATHAPAGPLPPRGLLVVDTSTVAPSASGSLTVAHDAAYGRLAGKAVAVEPSTGFAFDTPLEPRPR
jgi:hypothetical protein